MVLERPFISDTGGLSNNHCSALPGVKAGQVYDNFYSEDGLEQAILFEDRTHWVSMIVLFVRQVLKMLFISDTWEDSTHSVPKYLQIWLSWYDSLTQKMVLKRLLIKATELTDSVW